MKLYTFATLEEASASIKLLQARPHLNHYLFDGGILLITGIGPFAAYTACLPFIKDASAIYNFGIAGALNPHLTAGSVHPIATASKLAWHPRKSSTLPPIELQNKGMRLCTLDFPLHNTPIKEHLKKSFDLVDMEGYAIASIAKTNNKPCTLIKVVSDFCDEKTSAQIQKELGAYSTLIAEVIKRQSLQEAP